MYYWLQTVSASSELQILFAPNKGTYTNPFTNEIGIGNEPGVPGYTYTPIWSTVGRTGIDLFAYCVAHESFHYADFKQFWNLDSHKYYAQYRLVGRPETNGDEDADYLPNGFEDSNGDWMYTPGSEMFDYQQGFTPNAARPPTTLTTQGDEDEYVCYRTKDVMGNHSLDWAAPGFQY